jgi:hypothetical protein
MTHILRLPFGRSVTFTKLYHHEQLKTGQGDGRAHRRL